MVLCRIVGGRVQIYPLVGALHFPRSWRFVSYQIGAAAVAETELQAIVAARRELARKAMTKLFTTVTVTEREDPERTKREIFETVAAENERQQAEFVRLLKRGK